METSYELSAVIPSWLDQKITGLLNRLNLLASPKILLQQAKTQPSQPFKAEAGISDNI